AKVTIIEFSEFQCPHCSRSAETLRSLMKEYPDAVRLQFRHLTAAPGHDKAALAAEAAVAAAAQGRFWPMHDRLFGNQHRLERADLESYAQEIGLDLTKFRAALDNGEGKRVLAADRTLAQGLGLQATPTFFINGRKLTGSASLDEWRALVDEEIATGDRLVKAGTRPEQIYIKLLADARPVTTTPTRPPAKFEDRVFRVPVAGAYARGPAEAPIPIVEFSDFECPVCARAESILTQLFEQHPGQLRLVWKNHPLPSLHPHAIQAAEAALAAGEQGRFWEM